MTPKEAWSGSKPTVDRFKNFGCITYMHIPYEKRKKLDDNGVGVNQLYITSKNLVA